MLRFRSLSPGEQVHYLATANMWPRPAEVVEQIRPRPGLFQGIGQDREPGRLKLSRGHLSLFVGGPGERDDRGGQAGGTKGDRAEGVAEDAVEQAGLGEELFVSQANFGSVAGG